MGFLGGITTLPGLVDSPWKVLAGFDCLIAGFLPKGWFSTRGNGLRCMGAKTVALSHFVFLGAFRLHGCPIKQLLPTEGTVG